MLLKEYYQQLTARPDSLRNLTSLPRPQKRPAPTPSCMDMPTYSVFSTHQYLALLWMCSVDVLGESCARD
ncbi:hypothetical protein Pcinc_011699 [Petrolisthes cinctipes]|uniref:Uncharacterized protein n=1 Tax=Petrolisthes cinctipes TaxID=88211 RepID=A0AAE1G2C3_PETCI|nr:hypothetical protein Pcinc_011699 [Petrolisthes cinctipes]